MTVAQAVSDLVSRLSAAGVPTPEVDARLLARHVLGWSASDLVARGEQRLPPQAGDALAAAARRRAAREPLQLIIGTVGFRHLELAVAPGVFIPRPETEVLAGEAIARTPAGGIVVEPCTGTGAVACAVAAEAAPSRVFASDRSPAAVALARVNAARCGVSVDVAEGDLLDPVPSTLRGRVDVLVANPPYVALAEIRGLEPEVTDWDPLDALVSGPTGHEVSDALITAASTWLAPGGWLLLEVDPSRAAEVATRCSGAGFTQARCIPDLSGRNRIVAARRPV